MIPWKNEYPTKFDKIEFCILKVALYLFKHFYICSYTLKR